MSEEAGVESGGEDRARKVGFCVFLSLNCLVDVYDFCVKYLCFCGVLNDW